MNTRTPYFATILSLLLAGQALAAPPGFDVSTVTPATPFRGASALAYAADGTLYISEAVDFSTGPNTTSIRVFAPDGTEQTALSITGDVPNISIGGMAVDLSGNLLVTDNQANTLYSVNTTTGAKTTFAFTLADIDDVAVRPGTGEIFVSDAPFAAGGGAVYQVGGPADTSPTPVVTGLDFAAGLDFDSNGDLIYQNAILDLSTFTTTGEVHRLEVTETGSGLTFGPSTLLADNLIAAFDLAVDGEDDIFVTGGDFSAVGGLFQLDRDAAGNFLGTASLFEASTGDPANFGAFATEVDFLAGGPFAPDAGPGGILSFIAEFDAPAVTGITPSGSAVVPEPSSLLCAIICFGFAIAGYRLTQRQQQRVGK